MPGHKFNSSAEPSLCLASWRCFGREAGNYDTGATDTGIKLGQTMPYSGPASAYSAIGRAEIAYFKMLNEKGGINGRKVELLSMDDAYSPAKTVEQIRRLAESDEVLAMFSMLGTGPNIARAKISQRQEDPAAVPVERRQPLERSAAFPLDHRLAADLPDRGPHLRQVDSGEQAKRQDRRHHAERGSRPRLSRRLQGRARRARQPDRIGSRLRDDRPDRQLPDRQVQGRRRRRLFNECTPKFAAQAIKKIAELGWKPQIILPAVSNSVGSVLVPAGLENSVGIVTGAFLKDPGDPRWENDSGMKAWREWMKTYNSGADPADIFNVTGYTMAQMMEMVLQRAGNDLTRANLMKQTQSFKDVELPMLLPGIKLNTSAEQVTPIRQLQMARFNGKSWELFGDVIGE